MGDLIERLRRFSRMLQVDGHPPTEQPLHDQAADRIAALEAENERLREAVERILKGNPYTFKDGTAGRLPIRDSEVVRICETALAQQGAE